MKRASADVGLMFTAYNLRRIINILGKNVLKEYLRILVFHFVFVIGHIRAVLSRFWEAFFVRNINLVFFEHPANRLIFTRKLTINDGF